LLKPCGANEYFKQALADPGPFLGPWAIVLKPLTYTERLKNEWPALQGHFPMIIIIRFFVK